MRGTASRRRVSGKSRERVKSWSTTLTDPINLDRRVRCFKSISTPMQSRRDERERRYRNDVEVARAKKDATGLENIMIGKRRQGGFLTGWSVLTLFIATWGALLAAQDWPQWRGPNRDGVNSSFKAPSTWPDALK